MSADDAATGFHDLARRRRMVRRYRPDPVPREVVMRVLDTARRAPTAGFSQSVRFIVITDPRTRAAVARVCGEPDALARGLPAWLSVAPVHVLLCVDPTAYEERYSQPDKAGRVPAHRRAVPFAWVDAGAAMQTLLLAAVAEGLDAGFLDVDRAALETVVPIDADWDLVGLLTIGRRHEEASGPPRRKARLALEQHVIWRD